MKPKQKNCNDRRLKKKDQKKMIKNQLIGSENIENSWNNQNSTHSAKTEIRVVASNLAIPIAKSLLLLWWLGDPDRD